MMQLVPIDNQPEENEFIAQQKTQSESKKQQQKVEQAKSWQNLPFFDYFSSKIKGTQNLLLMQNKYNKNLQQKLQNQIKQGKTQIVKMKQAIVVNLKEQNQQQKFRRQRLELQRKKKAFKQSLSQVFEEQHNLLAKNISLMRNSRHRSHSNFESLNSNWKQDVALSLKRFKYFEEAVRQKDAALQEKVQKMRLNDQSNKIKLVQQIKMKNKNELIQKQRKYKQLKEQELLERQKSKLVIRKLKPEEYKFQQFQLKRNEQLRKVQSQRQLQQQTIRKQRLTVRKQLLQAHEQAYFEVINQRKQQWITQFQSFKALQKSKIRHYSGIYAQKILQQENKRKEEAQKSQEKKYGVMQKVKEFSQYVKEHFKPKHFVQVNPERQQSKEKHMSLSRFQQRSRGIQNLQYIKQKVKKMKTGGQQQQKVVQKASSLPKLNSKTVYKDYLKQQPSRVKRQMSTKQDFAFALSKRKQNWLQNAQSYIKKIQSKQKVAKGKPLIQTAFRKLELLNALY